MELGDEVGTEAARHRIDVFGTFKCQIQKSSPSNITQKSSSHLCHAHMISRHAGTHSQLRLGVVVQSIPLLVRRPWGWLM